MLQKWRNIAQFSTVLARISDCWGRSRWKSFHNVVNRRDGYTFIAVFEVKKGIPDGWRFYYGDIR
jgi:hypothetical protein